MINKLKKINTPLILGLILVSIILFIAIYGYQLIPLDPFSTHFSLPKVVDGELKIDNPPHDPNDINIWGTDVIGRDVFSRVIYGTKLTIQLGLLIALFRFLVALPFAFFAGFGGRISSKIIDIFNTTFSAIPALIVSFIVLGLGFIRVMEIESAVIAYIVVLTFVGWGRFATILRDRIKDILSKDFIKGEVAIGKNKFSIAVQNVLPHLFASILIYYLIEVSRVLIIIAELGVLGVYIGVNKVNMDLINELKIDIVPSYYPEWGSMLSSARYAITAWKPWIVIYPALAIFISVLGFNLLGEGLKIELNKRNSKFIIFLKHIPYHLSPRTYIYQIRTMKRYKKSVFIKTAVVVGIIIYFILPSPKSQFDIDKEQLYSHVEELSKEKYGGRKLGTEGKEIASEYILNQLKNSGVEPLFGESYIQKDSVEVNMKTVQKVDFYINTENKNVKFEFKKDYNLFRLFLDKTSDTTYSGEIRRRILSYENYEKGNYDENEKYFIVMSESRRYNHSTVMRLMEEKFIDGLFFVMQDAVIRSYRDIEIMGPLTELEKTEGFFGAMDFPVTQETADILKSYEGEEFVLDITLEYIDKYDVKNIGGVIKGKDSTKPPMILACNYDYKGITNGLEDEGLLYNGTSIATNLEVARVLKEKDFKPDRDIYVTFFDASITNKKKGMDAFRKSDVYENMSEDHFIMFLNYLGYKDSDTLFLDTSLLFSDNKAHYNFTKILTKRGKELDMNLKLDRVAEPMDGITNMNANGSSGISIGSVNDITRSKADTLEQNLKIIDEEKLEKQAQLIIDAITMYNYELK
ncbi:ABC transporter permease subunit [Clostridium sp. D2Q-11]|uniref:ABC transporter permease subunit n=1 Tax=Anaeromonas frigoriresistens TaxID=2683708 RepID=A0A942UTY4_9FIRM|nr:ABC transporter permease subunit [Anaeromonas frigoriresistens]MBS4539088.1 ABC transporter permease subunit [Anaeromonas frigoriresistens]